MQFTTFFTLAAAGFATLSAAAPQGLSTSTLSTILAAPTIQPDHELSQIPVREISVSEVGVIVEETHDYPPLEALKLARLQMRKSKTTKPVSRGEESAVVEKRDNRAKGWHTIYQHENFKGRSERLEYRENQCYNFGNGWDNYITSLKVSSPWLCSYYDSKNCVGRHVIYHDGDVKNVGVSWNDKFSSYVCVRYFSSGDDKPSPSCGSISGC